MIVLGFDTATRATAVALRRADGRTSEARDDPPATAHPGHATRLLRMSHELLISAGMGWKQIDRVAVGVGPGTFTGLRVGVASARGLAQSLSAELVGVSSLRALATAALRDVAVDGRGGVLAVIDARRGETFAAAYASGEEGMPLRLAPARVLAPGELAGVIEEADRAAGANLQWTAVGDGALCYREQLETAAVRILPSESLLHLVSAAAICELGTCGTVARLNEMVPDYRRRPDAELALTGGVQPAST
jgi:tRNA threonylcarbamoyladenosine biosynthesis protein TsaB